MTLRYLSAGESHGPSLSAVVEGFPANLEIDPVFINLQLGRRQGGYGRGGRMKIEKDKVEFRGGVRFCRTTGAPLALLIHNKDFANWEDRMAPEGITPADLDIFSKPRPGHADLAGGLKYNQEDLRNILERASARETAIRVAVGSIARLFLLEFGIRIYSHVVAVGGISADSSAKSPREIEEVAEKSPLRCADSAADKKMIKAIDAAREEGDSLGGVFEVVALNVPVGLGSHVQGDRRLDGRLAGAFMSVQAVKGVEIGMGFAGAHSSGSKVHDEIFYSEEKGYYRLTNRAGGIEGGMSNGSPVVVRAALKPIPTLYKPLRSVDMKTHSEYKATIERSDVCAVPAASIVGEAVLAWELAVAFLDKFGGDSIDETKRNFHSYMEYLKER